MQEGKDVVSRALKDTEKRYANIEREMLAVVVTCEEFHSYLFGKRVLVESDHKLLEMIHLKNLTESHKDMIWKSSRNLAQKCFLLSKEPLDLHKVCLVRFSDAKLNAVRKDTLSDPELSALREIIY